MSVIGELREQRRADRSQQAADLRADRAAEREQERADRREQQREREARRGRRQEQFAAARAWLVTHPVELLLSMIVVVPGALAWSAMAAYGSEIYGPLGFGLPLFSEAAMWAFAFAAHAARRAGRPTGWLQVGLWVFTAVSGVLNFLHGVAGVEGSLIRGTVMALVAVGGPVAHQLITASPMRTRRTRAQRGAARTARVAARRTTRMERAAVRQAVGHLDADGTVRLVHSPGTVTLSPRRFRRARLVPGVVPGIPVTPIRDLGAELRGLLAAGVPEPAGTAETAEPGTAEGVADEVAAVRAAIAAGELPEGPSRRRVQAHLGVRASRAQAIVRALRGEVAA